MKKEQSLEDKFIAALDSERCEDCGEYSEFVEYTTCPYSSDVDNEEVWVWLCPECLHERRMDI